MKLFIRENNSLQVWRRILTEQMASSKENSVWSKEQAEQLRTQIANMKQYLSSIVQSYGYKNEKEFLAEYRASKAEYSDYQSAVAKWEKQRGNRAEMDSFKARLQ